MVKINIHAIIWIVRFVESLCPPLIYATCNKILYTQTTHSFTYQTCACLCNVAMRVMEVTMLSVKYVEYDSLNNEPLTHNLCLNTSSKKQTWHHIWLCVVQKLFLCQLIISVSSIHWIIFRCLCRSCRKRSTRLLS